MPPFLPSLRKFMRRALTIQAVVACSWIPRTLLRFNSSNHNGSDKVNPSTASTGSQPLGSGLAFASSGTTEGTEHPRNAASVHTHTRVPTQDKSTGKSAVNTTPGAAAGSTFPRRTQPFIPLRSAPMDKQSGDLQSRDNATQVQSSSTGETAFTTAARPEDGPTVPDYGPLRATGLWSVEEVLDETKKTVDFRKIDEVESHLIEELKEPDEALIPYDEEERWKHKLMFRHKFKKTPKHLTWKELGEEIECVDCTIDPDEHRPEEIFTIQFYFTDKKSGTRDVVWSARNDVAYSEGFTDLLAAIGACLGRSEVHRTIRFDDGLGTIRDISIRKRSRYTSDIQIAFRPAEKYDKFQRKEEQDEYEAAMEADGMSTWGFHPALMDPEFSELDYQDPEGTYEVAMSAHGFGFVFLKSINRLLSRPMKDFYRPSQLMRTAKVRTADDIGLAHAMKGWMGIDEQIYPHYIPIEALQDHWLGKDAPFSLCAIVNKLREMCYLKPENPEYQSWLSVRRHDTHVAIRNVGVKLLGVGASTLFMPVAHNATVNRLLPKNQQRRLESKFSINAVLGLPDETRRLEEFKQITGYARLSEHRPADDSKGPVADIGNSGALQHEDNVHEPTDRTTRTSY